MRTLPFLFVALALVWGLSGCKKAPDPTPEKTGTEQSATPTLEPKMAAARSKLSPEDRKLVDAQDMCPIGERLGSMGTPVKILVKDQPVFLCCQSCEADALADPDQTLAKVEKFRAQSKGTAPK